jgi:hypothetical protein
VLVVVALWLKQQNILSYTEGRWIESRCLTVFTKFNSRG